MITQSLFKPFQNFQKFQNMGWEDDLKSEMKRFITLLAPIKPYFRLENLNVHWIAACEDV